MRSNTNHGIVHGFTATYRPLSKVAAICDPKGHVLAEIPIKDLESFNKLKAAIHYMCGEVFEQAINTTIEHLAGTSNNIDNPYPEVDRGSIEPD